MAKMAKPYTLLDGETTDVLSNAEPAELEEIAQEAVVSHVVGVWLRGGIARTNRSPEGQLRVLRNRIEQELDQ